MALGDTVKKSINFKDISQVMSNFLCLYSYHAYFILLLKSENVLQKEMKSWLSLWSLFID